jgi:hypothetical protein
MVDVAGIEPATPCLQTRWVINTKGFVWCRLHEKSATFPLSQVSRSCPESSSAFAARLQTRWPNDGETRAQRLKLASQQSEKRTRPDDLDSAIILKTEKRPVPADDVVRIGGKCRFQEFVIVGVLANSLGE